MKTSFILTWVATILAMIASAVGLFVPGIYHDNAFVQTLWQGNDWVTLLFIVPALGFTLMLVQKGVAKAQLIWMGLLGYLFYNYAFYLFGAAYNAVFLLYILIFSLSVFALISGLSALQVQHLQFMGQSARWIMAYLLLIVFILGMVELPPNIQYLMSGQLPDTITLTQHPTAIVYALDLSVVVPVSVLAVVLLWHRKNWGYVLAVIMLVKGAAYGMVLMVNSFLLKYFGTGEDALLPFYIFIMLGGLAGLVWMLKQIHIPEIKVAAHH